MTDMSISDVVVRPYPVDGFVGTTATYLDDATGRRISARLPHVMNVDEVKATIEGRRRALKAAARSSFATAT